MSTLISFCDSRMSVQLGERTHREHGWFEDIQERILQLSFQLTRSVTPEQLNILRGKYQTLIWGVFSSKDIATSRRREFMSLIYRLMLHTRDIINGKGEYMLSYMMLGEWVRFGLCCVDRPESALMANNLANAAIESFVKLEGFDHPYGSWKDMKYFANYLRDHVARDNDMLINLPIFKHMIKIIVEQLHKDVKTLQPSLMCKWLPREKSKKFGWLAKHIAVEYNKEWINSSSNNSYYQAVRKCQVHYRQTIAQLNRQLNTVQIDQCAGTWRNINFEKNATSITLARQKEAFQYVDRKGEFRGSDNDRMKCRDNFEAYIDKCATGELEIKGARVELTDFVKEAIHLSHINISGDKRELQRTALNLQWANSGKDMKGLTNFIAMVDTSESMNCDGKKPLYSAIGLGCRVAEHSKLGRRVITFSAAPQWIDLSASMNLTDMVAKISESESWGMNSNFVRALKLILDACVEKDLAPEVVSDLVLAVFSDMQIDQAGIGVGSMKDLIDEMFAVGGNLTSHGCPYTAPHILFWNLRSTNGFPSLSTSKNTSMLSGFNPQLLNTFCNKGLNTGGICTPWTIINEQLFQDRYKWGHMKVSQYGNSLSSASTANIFCAT